MNTTHTALLVVAMVLAVVVSLLAAGTAFAVARWGGSRVPECVATASKAFAATLTVIIALLAVVITALP